MLKIKQRKHKIYFIDYENVHNFNLNNVDFDKSKVFVFIGNLQQSIPYKTVTQLQKLGKNAEYVKMVSQGKNCLDFHICYKMGELNLIYSKYVEFIVVSKDKGFDNILNYAKSLGRHCKRVDSL